LGSIDFRLSRETRFKQYTGYLLFDARAMSQQTIYCCTRGKRIRSLADRDVCKH